MNKQTLRELSLEDALLVEFMHLVFTRMPGESYCRRYKCYSETERYSKVNRSGGIQPGSPDASLAVAQHHCTDYCLQFEIPLVELQKVPAGLQQPLCVLGHVAVGVAGVEDGPVPGAVPERREEEGGEREEQRVVVGLPQLLPPLRQGQQVHRGAFK